MIINSDRFKKAFDNAAGKSTFGRAFGGGSWPGSFKGSSDEPGGRPQRARPAASPKKSMVTIILITLILAAVIFYNTLPALNLMSRGFWSYLFTITLIYAVLHSIRSGMVGKPVFESVPEGGKRRKFKLRKLLKPVPVAILIFILPAIISFFGSSKLLHAKAYSRILTVEEGTVENIPTVEKTDSIALMDTASAEKLGDREIGSLSNVISQYDVSEYTQINYQEAPVKTAPLAYAGFIKWFKNRSSGVPGYVIVNPVSMTADYVALEEGMKYVPSAHFQKNIERHIRFSHPTAMFDNLHFEIDEEGKPWYVASVYTHKIGLFGGKQVKGIILADPVGGGTQYYAAKDIPVWVDDAFSGTLICEQYNNYGILSGGYINSVFGQTGCRKVTEYSAEDDSAYSDFGYIAKDGDIWIYTGVTSVNSDSSNIGFILSNERTEKTYFITCAGADEFSAMASAEGEVQEKGYKASFPSLILINGKPTYIMVLKDNSGLVKQYAAVDVEQYNKVATAYTQDECLAKYEKLMKGAITQAQATADTGEPGADKQDSGSDKPASADAAPLDTSDFEEKTITIKKIQTIDIDGNTWIYIADSDKHIYKAPYTDVIDMMLAEEGDEITIKTDGERFVLP